MCKYCKVDPDLKKGAVIIEHDLNDYNADMFIVGAFRGTYYFQLNISDTYEMDSSCVQINFCPMCGRKLKKEQGSDRLKYEELEIPWKHKSQIDEIGNVDSNILIYALRLRGYRGELSKIVTVKI